MKLFCQHEKEYFKSRSPKTFVMSENGPIIKVSGFGNDTSVNEKFVWGGYEPAAKSAKKYLVEPAAEPMGINGRYRLAWP